MQINGAELRKRLSMSMPAGACFMLVSRWVMTMCRQQNIKPIKPHNSAMSIKKNLKLAKAQSAAANPPNAKEMLKAREISVFINDTTLPPIFQS